MDPDSSKSAERRDEHTHDPRVEKADAMRVSMNVCGVSPRIAVAEEFAKQETNHQK